MSEIKIFRPQAGQRVEITPTAEGRLALDFVPQDATIARQGEDLVFSFPDGGTVVLVGFYDLPADHLPEFAVDGVANYQIQGPVNDMTVVRGQLPVLGKLSVEELR